MSAAIEGQAHLLLNNMFGGIALQTAMLEIPDLMAVQVAFKPFPSKPTPILKGTLLIMMLALLQGVILIGDLPVFGHIGLGSILPAVL